MLRNFLSRIIILLPFCVILWLVSLGLTIISFTFEFGEGATSVLVVNATIVTIVVYNLWLGRKKDDFLQDSFLLGGLWIFFGAALLGPIIAITSGYLLKEKLARQADGEQGEARDL